MTRRLFWQLWGFYMIRISTCWPGPCLRFVFPGFYTLSSWGAHTLLLLLKLSIKQYQELQTLNGKPIAGKNVSFHLLPQSMSRPCSRLRQGNWPKGYKRGSSLRLHKMSQNWEPSLKLFLIFWLEGKRSMGEEKQWSEEKKEREAESGRGAVDNILRTVTPHNHNMQEKHASLCETIQKKSNWSHNGATQVSTCTCLKMAFVGRWHALSSCSGRYFMVLHDKAWFLMVLSSIDTVGVILCDWCDLEWLKIFRRIWKLHL